MANRKRITVEGAGFGLIAGVIFLAAEMFDSAVTSGLPADPLRRAASVVLGFHALDSSLGTTFLAGLVLYGGLSALAGVGYAQFEFRLPADTRRHYGWQARVGAVYAGLLWTFGAVVTQRFFPWLVTEAPLRQLLIQALFYGGALGLMFASAERRTPLVVRPSVG